MSVDCGSRVTNIMTNRVIAGHYRYISTGNIKAIFSGGCYEAYDAPMFSNGHRRYIKVDV